MWIIDHLPESGKDVLVLFKDKDNISHVSIGDSNYDGSRWTVRGVDDLPSMDSKYDDFIVYAWMPYPDVNSNEAKEALNKSLGFNT